MLSGACSGLTIANKPKGCNGLWDFSDLGRNGLLSSSLSCYISIEVHYSRYSWWLLNAFVSMQFIRNTVDTLLLVLKNTKVHSRIRWSNIGTRMGTESSTTFVKWNLWILWLFGRGFLCSCIFDVDLNTAVAIEAGFGPSWVEPLRVCVILPLSAISACQSNNEDGKKKKI